MRDSKREAVWGGVIPFIIIMMLAVPGRLISAQSDGEEREFHQTYPLAGNGTVSLINSSGSVRITSWNQNQVKVDAVKRGRRSSDFTEVRIEVTSNPESLQIKTIYPRGRNVSVSVDYTITVPKTAGLDAIRTASGAIDIAGPLRRVTANTASGDISANTISEDATLSTASGSITAQRISGELRAQTASGNISVDGADSRLFAQTASGSIKVRNVRDDSSLRSASGDIRVEQAGGRVNARATSGSIFISDAGGDVQANSLSDNVTVNNVKGRANASTLSGSISLTGIEDGIRARAVSGKVQISRSKGRIDVSTTSDSITFTDLLSEDVVAKTTRGEVRFTGALQTGGNYNFESFSGNVIVILPADSGFNLTSRTNRDNLKSDFAIQADQSFPSSRRDTLTAVVGNGGPDLRVATFSGNVYLKKR